MGYDEDNLINCYPNDYGMYHNWKPAIGTIYELPDDHPIKNYAQTMDKVWEG